MRDVRTFDDLYLKVARMNKKNRKMIITCLLNRSRQLKKEWAQSQRESAK